jgi:hypothetical protein
VGEAFAARSAQAEAGRSIFPVERSSQTVSQPADQQVEIASAATATRTES